MALTQSVLPPPWERGGKSYDQWKKDVERQKAIDEYWANKPRGGGGLAGGEGGDGSAALEEAQAKANEIAMAQLEIARRQQEIAEERYNWWKENYQPFEKEFIQRAKMGEDTGYAAERAGREQQIALQAAKDTYGREIQRYGISADDPRYQQLLSNWDLYKQAAVAGARNTARQQAAEKTRQLRAQVAGMGTGLAPQAIATYSGAGQTMTGGAQTLAQGAAGLAGAYNAGMKNRLSAEQFAADLAARQGSLSLGQQELAAKSRLFDQQLASAQKQYNIGQQTQLYGALGQLAGLGMGYGINYMMTPSNTTIPSVAPSTGNQPYNLWGSSGLYFNQYAPLLQNQPQPLTDYASLYRRQ